MHLTLPHHRVFQVLLAVAGALLVAFAASSGGDLRGYLVRQEEARDTQWKLFTVEDVEKGVSVPPDTNVVFHLPEDIRPIHRRVLFGNAAYDVRYWGYCYPDYYDPETAPTTYGFPGKIFLSEAEQSWRRKRIESERPIFSIYNPPTKPDVAVRPDAGRIRNQFVMFSPGATCYVMTSKALPLGTDRDGDGLNSRLEADLGSDPAVPDTDGDGLTDGIEVRLSHTQVLLRDSDGDGLIEGIEDANRNGHIDAGETNPAKNDTDGDELCDGLCRVGKDRRVCTDFAAVKSCRSTVDAQWLGEDKNLNGKVDQGETDPRKWSTKGDGISDLQKFFNCQLKQGKDC